MKTIRIVLFALASFCLSISSFAEGEKKYPELSKEKIESIELFQKVIAFIENNYVDPVKIKSLTEGALRGMVDSLDPHSNFLTEEIYKEMKTDTSGKFGGVGIEVGVKDEQLVVVTPMEGTPAWKAGVRSGDRITKINGENITGVNLSEAISKMRGKAGTVLKMTLQREGQKPKDYSLVREMIKLKTVRFEMIEPGFGYIHLSNFNEDASQDIISALQKLEQKNALKGLVLDLRNNPGGLLDQAVEIVSLFIDQGDVVSTIGRDLNQKEVRSVKKMKFLKKDLPLIVLVNSGSASASEIVAGALQDHHRAVIVGQTTFGKGSVQTIVDLGPSMGLKLTIARYYTPSGKSIQEKGVQPDIPLEEFDAKLLSQARLNKQAVREKNLKGHFKNTDKDSAQAVDTQAPDKENDEDELFAKKLNPSKDYQVIESIRLLKASLLIPSALKKN